MKICFIITASMNLHSLYRGQFVYLMEQGYKVFAIASPGVEHEWLRSVGVTTFIVPMSRRPDIINDIISVGNLIKTLNSLELDLIVISTPKASLLGAIAAKLSSQRSIPLIYMIRGRAYENFSGIKRIIFKKIDFFICRVSTYVISISKELQVAYENEFICRSGKILVLGKGSSNGVDLNRFRRENFTENELGVLRSRLEIDSSAFVFLYCGRLRKEKGTEELYRAFINLKKNNDGINVHLLLVGEFESFDEVDSDIKSSIISDKSITLVNWSKEIEIYYAISSAFVFPSYREGFGNVAIEASSMKLPVIGYNVVGLRESIDDGSSGILVDKGDVIQLEGAMRQLLVDPLLCRKLGNQGRERVEQYFDDRVVWSNLNLFYMSCIKK